MLRKLHIGSALGWSLVALVVLIVAARIAAPYLIERVVNDKLSNLEGYTGSIGDVDLHLWRGAYEVETSASTRRAAKCPCLSSRWSASTWASSGAPCSMARSSRALRCFDRRSISSRVPPRRSRKRRRRNRPGERRSKTLIPMRIDSFMVVDGEVHLS